MQSMCFLMFRCALSVYIQILKDFEIIQIVNLIIIICFNHFNLHV